MVLHLESKRSPSRALSLDGFTSFLAQGGFDPNDREALIAVAPLLGELGANRNLLRDVVMAELTEAINFQPNNLYGPNVFLLYSCKEYFIRANVWKPETLLEKKIVGFRYDICHDHNFDILTVGFFGPGYKSRTYTYDNSKISGEIGENAHLEKAGEVVLGEGVVLLYRAKEDVHVQLPPESLSISLNFIPKNRWLLSPQFEFDERTGSIIRYLHNFGPELFMRFAGVFKDNQCLPHLQKIRQSHPNPHVRALAAVSQVAIVPGSESEVLRWAEDEPPNVRSIVLGELENPGAALRRFQIKSAPSIDY